MEKIKKGRRYSRRFLKLIIMVLSILLLITTFLLIFRFNTIESLNSTPYPVNNTLPPSYEASVSPLPAHTSAVASSPEATGMLVLVNWDNPLPSSERPSDLVPLNQVFNDEVELSNPDGSINYTAGRAASDMFKAALQQGITKFKIVSAYRSVSYQESLFRQHKNSDPDYGGDPYNDPVEVMPGNMSEHSTGLAIDIISSTSYGTDAAFGSSPEGLWLKNNAYKFGFILRYPEGKENITGVIYEPWHYRYVGTIAAKDVFTRGICLEEYFK